MPNQSNKTMRFRITVKYKTDSELIPEGTMRWYVNAPNEEKANDILQKSGVIPEGGVITKTTYAPKKRK